MRKLINLFRRNRERMERDLDRELRYHVDRRVEDLKTSGLSHREASRQAAIEFGGLTHVQEEVRDTWIWRWLQDLARDIRYAVRTLRRSSGFAATVVVSLALGIGANTAIFSILHALVLRSLPVYDPQRLSLVGRPVVSKEGVTYSQSFSYPTFRALQEGSQSLEALMAFRTINASLSVEGVTERINSAIVSGNYFEVLGIRPVMGTAIAKDDDQKPGSGGWRGPVAVLSHGFWTRRFGGQNSAIGSRILLNGTPFTLVGVAPAGFDGTEVGELPDVFVPMMMQPAIIPGNSNALTQRRNVWLRIMARRKPDVSVSQAEAELTALLQRFNQETLQAAGSVTAEFRRSLMSQRLALLPGAAGLSPLRQQYAKPLWVLMAVMGLVLLIACANVANLLLSRAAARHREIAVRLGLGAARSRLIAQLLTESLLLAGAGSVSGLVLARWLRDVLMGYLPPERNLSAPLDVKVLVFTLALTIGAGLLFGLAPAFASTNVDVAPALKGEEAAAKPLRVFLRKGLVVLQIGLSCLLVMAATLFLRSLHNLLIVDTGFAREKILLASIGAGMNRSPDFYPRLMEEVRHLPGVVSAGLADFPPLGNHTNWPVYIPGYTPRNDEPRDDPSVGWISPGYFETMTLSLLLGRDFEPRDLASQSKVMIVNETFAKHYFQGQNPVGRRLGTSQGKYDFEIVGVVKDGKYSGLREGSMRMMYVPIATVVSPLFSNVVLHLRSATPPANLASALRQKVRELDRSVTVFNVHTVEQEIDRSLSRERLVGMVTGLFGALALVLAAVGLYGMTAYGVSRRTREFGIRMAIGAEVGSIVRLVLRDAMWIVIGGVTAGLAAVWALGRIVSSMLFGIEAMDSWSAAAAVIVLSTVALIAAWIPARRASRVDPVRALRYQ